MSMNPEASQDRPLPARTEQGQRVSETAPKPPAGAPRGAGIDTTRGPSQVPAGATLPPSEPVVPGKGRPPR